MSAAILCPMCGSAYDPDNQAVCQGCPLQRSCSLVRCPQCGFETPDLRHSTAVSLAQRLLKHFSKTPVQIPTVEHPNR
jgi:predicted amidophosphoribosyltransferase